MATYKIQHRNDTTANWNSHNPVLLKGELGIEFQSGNTVAWKVGDGVTAWSSLPYSSGPAGPKGTTGPAGPQGPQGPSGSSSGGMRPPSTSYTNYTGTSGFTAPSDGWIHIRARATGNTLSIGVINNTTGIEAHGVAIQQGHLASLLMPVRAGDSISASVSVGAYDNPVCRFHPAS